LKATDRYELIRPILQQEKTVKDVCTETEISISTLYRCLKRFRESDGQLEVLADKSHAAHSHPSWFTEEDKDMVVSYKLMNPHKSNRQIAQELTETKLLSISCRSVDKILAQRCLSANFFSTSLPN